MADLDRLIEEVARGGWRQLRASRALSRDFGPETEAALRQALATHPSTHVKQCAAQLLVRSDQPETVAQLTFALRDEDPLVRGNAAWSLKRVGGAAVLEDLATAAQRAVSRYRQDPLLGMGELYAAIRTVGAISDIAAAGPPPARWWALDFLRRLDAEANFQEPLFAPAIERLETAVAGTLPRPAAPPAADHRDLPRPGREPEP
ncbi:MAG: hypothetical protein K0Q72_3681 [Armatimonadetes bacterium]|nr:hypothetical protein [Armatimonadota bacterium]